MITFQEIIARLSAFWEKQGCIIQQGHDLEMGAGTFNPATFLRCLGPEPYNTAYVEPCRRPKDGRYGENPNRVHLFHQYQVIMKPSPLDIQNTYLESLRALGIALEEHDIRFVHDDWEGPTLGAWGLGWEVWMDGMEITQFTFFQAMGSIPLKPVSVEITYGLERLAMYIQNVSNIFDIRWNEHLTLGELSKENEIEWSKYNFEKASTEMWLRHFDDFEKEAKNLIQENLPIPAYDFVMKASHAFNILDARGVISVTERTGYIGRIRDLARLIAVEYIASRERLGFPLLVEKKAEPTKIEALSDSPYNPQEKSDFLLEIGSEQLPATFVPIGSTELQNKVKKLLDEHSLSYESLQSYGTPRRLAIYVKGLALGTQDSFLEKRGPAISAAFTENGSPTAQGEGFFRSLGLPAVSLVDIQNGKVPSLQILEIKGTQYLLGKVTKLGVSTRKILSENLAKILSDLHFPKKMQWADLDISYARPIHWIVSLLGKEIVPFSFGPVHADRFSFGHMQLCPIRFEFSTASEYIESLKKHYVLVDSKERRQSIISQLRDIEKRTGFHILQQDRVLSEVVHLCEWPHCMTGNFSEKFLEAPLEVLTSEMVEHQRYFPLAKSEKELSNTFVITADTTPNDLIRRGNERVLSARLSDGVFMYEQDVKIPLEKFNEKLQLMTFQKDLGSVYDKIERIKKHAEIIQDFLRIGDKKKVQRAATLCKSDLASSLVGEFPELQGTIGMYYAKAQKEDAEVALAISEHWMPKAEGASLPSSPTGIIISLADKIDNLLGYYSVGLKPSSSSDPYALRRQTIGILRMLLSEKKSISLDQLLSACSCQFSMNEATAKETISEILSFMKSRAKSVFEEEGFTKEEIEAIFSRKHFDPYDLLCIGKALQIFTRSSDFAKFYEVYKRVKGQVEKSSPLVFSKEKASEPSEKALIVKLEEIEPLLEKALLEKHYEKAFSLLASLQPYLAELFEKVKILSDDMQIRENRIALLQKIYQHFENLVDFSKMQNMVK